MVPMYLKHYLKISIMSHKVYLGLPILKYFDKILVLINIMCLLILVAFSMEDNHLSRLYNCFALLSDRKLGEKKYQGQKLHMSSDKKFFWETEM